MKSAHKFVDYPFRKHWGDFGRPHAFAAQQRTPQRLVVFVHGFGGQAQGTWRGFEPSNLTGAWWKHADLVFVDYDSVRVEIALTATRLRGLVTALLEDGPLDPTGEDDTPYGELVLVGHSMGGTVIRMMLLEAAADYRNARNNTEEADRQVIHLILNARVRLFAPALSGARPTGLLAVAQRMTSVGMRGVSPTYQELVDPSLLLLPLRHRTESEMADDTGGSAHCLWASRDQVISHGVPYATDAFDGFLRGTDHRSVCKPAYASVCKPAYTPAAVEFVETGCVPDAELEGRP